MAVFNEEKYIAEAIESLLAQTYKDFIFIISDNASTDRTSKICKYYAERDKRIIYIRQSRNLGAFFNSRYVLDKTNTPLFMWASGHDKWHPQFVEKLLPVIQKEDLILIYPQSRVIKIDGSIGEIYQDDYTTIGEEEPTKRYLYILKNIRHYNILHGIWKTQILKSCYIRPVISNDILLLLSASLLGKFKQYKQPLFFRRIVRNERSRDKYLRQFCMITGKNVSKRFYVQFFKLNFILENIKMLLQKNLPLSIKSRFILIIYTTYKWSTKFYIRPILRRIFKSIRFLFK